MRRRAGVESAGRDNRPKEERWRRPTSARRTTLEERHEEEQRAVSEGGGGEAEGFELAEEELIEHASHGDPGPDPSNLAGEPEDTAATRAARPTTSTRARTTRTETEAA